MKILHTADWHLGKRLDNFSRLPEQVMVLDEICEIADREDVDAVIVAGDLFDSVNPPIEAIELFYKALKRLSRDASRLVVAIAGNHDSPDRIESPDPLARECGIVFAGYPNTKVPAFSLDSGLEVVSSEPGFVEFSLPSCDVNLRLLLTPYANEVRLKTFLGYEDTEEELRQILADRWQFLADKYCDDKGVNVLASHLFVVGRGEPQPEEPDDEKPILHVGGAQVVYTDNIPLEMQYTALGHLHRKQLMSKGDRLVAYSGSPVSYSFAESNQNKYALIVEAEPGEKASVKEVELTAGKRLLRKRLEGVDAAVEWLSENTEALVELTVVSDTYLTGEDRRRLFEVHNGIISIIPEVINDDLLSKSGKATVDLSQNIQDLFREYFVYKQGQEPNDSIMSLFNEVIAEDK